MPLQAIRDQQVMVISGGFALLFFAFSGAEQFLVLYYFQIGDRDIAVTTLLLLNSLSIPASFFAPWFMHLLGIKYSLVLPVFFYAALITSFSTHNPILIYPLAFLVGLSGVPMGITRSLYLMDAAIRSQKFAYGESLGTCEMVRSIGSSLGVAAVSLISWILGRDLLFVVFGLCALSSVVFFCRVEKINLHVNRDRQPNIRAVLTNKPLWLLMPLFLAPCFLVALTLTDLPIQLSIHGEYIVGFVSIVFSLGPVTLPLLFGKLADIRFGTYRTAILGSALIAEIFVVVILLLTDQLIWLTLSAICISAIFSIGATVSGTLVGDLFPQEHWRDVQSILGLISSIGISLPFVIEQLFSVEYVPYLTVGTCILACCCLSIIQRNRTAYQAPF